MSFGNGCDIDSLAVAKEILEPQSRNLNEVGMHMTLGESLVKAFQLLDPPEFKGSSDIAVAEEWFGDIEKKLGLMSATDEQRVTLATAMLKGEASYWWDINKYTMVTEGMTWREFVNSFLERYYPFSERKMKKNEPLQLVRKEFWDRVENNKEKRNAGIGKSPTSITNSEQKPQSSQNRPQRLLRWKQHHQQQQQQQQQQHHHHHHQHHHHQHHHHHHQHQQQQQQQQHRQQQHQYSLRLHPRNDPKLQLQRQLQQRRQLRRQQKYQQPEVAHVRINMEEFWESEKKRKMGKTKLIPSCQKHHQHHQPYIVPQPALAVEGPVLCLLCRQIGHYRKDCPLMHQALVEAEQIIKEAKAMAVSSKDNANVKDDNAVKKKGEVQ